MMNCQSPIFFDEPLCNAKQAPSNTHLLFFWYCTFFLRFSHIIAFSEVSSKPVRLESMGPFGGDVRSLILKRFHTQSDII